MGTAPDDRQYPAMPDPDRVVRGSLAALRRLGLSDWTALEVIATVADRTWVLASEHSPDFRGWLADVRRIAVERQVSLGKSGTDRKGHDHADG